jgi:hypothetical protein
MANKLNMAIAKTHRLSSRLIGMQLTGGNFLGIALSAVQMSAGFLILGEPIYQAAMIIAGAIVLIGMVLAVLIERLSLGGLSAVRVSRQKLRDLETAYYQMEEPTEQQTRLFEARRKEYRADTRIGWLFGILGMCLSAGLGDVFWHRLFEPLQPPLLGFLASVACAAVIGLTFISSELYKALLDGVLKEILSDNTVMRTAVAVEEQSMQLDMMVEAYEAVKNDAEVREPAEERIRKTIGRRLTGFANQVSAAADQVAGYNQVTVVEGSAQPLALPAPRGQYHQHKAELQRLLRNNPNMSVRELARHFGKSTSTINSWMTKLRNGE